MEANNIVLSKQTNTAHPATTSNKIKVVRIIDRLNIGGPAIHCILLSAYLNPQKFSTTLITGNVSSFEGDMSYFARQHNIQWQVIPNLGREISLLHDLKTCWQLFKILRKEKPQIIHTHKSKAGALGRFVALLLGIPIRIHTFHGHVFHGYFGKWKSRLFIFIERILAYFTSRIIVISQQQLQEISLQYHIAPAHKFSVIPLGFDFDKFSKLHLSQGWLRQKFNIAQNEIIVGIVGRLTAVKNHFMFLEVAQNLKQQNAPFRMVIIGDGELRPELEAKTKQLGLEGYVIFTGWLQNPCEIYADLDIVALTSLNEGTPVTLIEAMYCGKPVVATNVGGISDFIQSGVHGILVPSQDIANFAKAIILLQNKDLQREYGQAGKHVATKFAIERLLSDIEKLYIELIS